MDCRSNACKGGLSLARSCSDGLGGPLRRADAQPHQAGLTGFTYRGRYRVHARRSSAPSEFGLTDLIWKGKYDSAGGRVPPLRVSLPFQTIETVNESAQQRQKTLHGFSRQERADWKNRLIWGDNKYVIPSLVEELGGKIDLIYIDPPFATGQDFSFRANAGDLSFLKEPNLIEQKVWRDTWGRGLDSFLTMLSDRFTLMRELLSDSGSIFVHMGSEVSHLVRELMEESFGSENFRNEIILPGRAVKNLQQQFDSIQRLQIRHDVLLWSSKSAATRFRPHWVEKHDAGNPEGHWHHAWSTADRPTMRYELLGVTPKTGQWVWETKRANVAVANYNRFLTEGGDRSMVEYWRDTGSNLEFIRPGPKDGKPQYWREPADYRIGDTVWSGIPVYSATTGYPTEKNERLLEEVLRLASSEGDLVADFFCGSGTTLAVAEKLGRRWVGCDLARWAVHTARKRLLLIQDVRPFMVQNLGKYERQLWQAAEFGTDAASKIDAYRRFILKLYRAEPISGFTWFQGSKGNRFVHVGSVDSPVSHEDVKGIVGEFESAIGSGPSAPKSTGVDVLGWDFAFEINEVSKQEAAREGVDLRFKRIPRDVLDPKAVEQGDMKFFELAALASKVSVDGRAVSVALADFTIPPDDVPEEVRRTITHWIHWVDYWAIDWDNKDDTFHNEWQSFRSKDEPTLKTKASHTYPHRGTYSVVVKVIDILGNDTTKLLPVKVA